MPHPEDLQQNVNINQNQQQHLNINEWEVLNGEQIQENFLQEQHQNNLTSLAKNTVLEQNGQIDFKLAKTSLSKQERKDMTDKLNATTPEQIENMTFGELVVWARESATIESGSRTYLSMANQLSKVDQMRKEVTKLLAENKPCADLQKQTMNEIASLGDYAHRYLKTHDTWNKAVFHKGKCRLALAQRILKEQDMVVSLNLVQREIEDYKISENFNLDSVRVTRIFVKDSKSYLAEGERIREKMAAIEDENISKLYEKFTLDIDGAYARNQFLDLFKGTYTENGYTITPEEENRVTEALDQYYNKKNVRPLFNIIDERANEVLNINFDESYFAKEKINEDPHNLHRFGFSVGARMGNLFEFKNPLGKAYLADLKQRNPKKAEALEEQTGLLGQTVATYPQSIELHYGIRVVSFSNKTKQDTDVLEEIAHNNMGYMSYHAEDDYGDLIYQDEEGKYHYKGAKQFVEDTVRYHNDIKQAHAKRGKKA